MAMEMDAFDDFARRLNEAGSSRRQALRALGSVLLGGGFGGVAATFGLAEGAGAKSKQHTSKRKKERPSQVEQRAQGRLQAEGKGKKKRKGNGKKEPLPNPCPPNLRPCPDGSCIPVSKCCPGRKSCPGEGCIPANECCEGERRCLLDKTCIPKDECCEGQKKCAKSGRCVGRDDCCPEQTPCGGECLPEGECCEHTVPLCGDCDEAVCENGAWECRSSCPSGEVCCSGACYDGSCSNGCEKYTACGTCSKPPPGHAYCGSKHLCVSAACPPGQQFDSATCRCECSGGLQKCADGSCCDGQCTQYTCCIPGNRCIPNGRHGICCSPKEPHDCYVNGVFRGCYDPEKCTCTDFGIECPR